MADIQRYPFVRHLRGAPTVHVRHQHKGRLVREGTGLSFWFRPLSAVISEVPVDDREIPMMFKTLTNDFQDVSVQATVTYRITDPAAAAARLDFSLDPDTGVWRAAPLEQIGSLLIELAQQYAVELLASAPLHAALTGGHAAVRERIATGLADDPRLRDTGITVLGVRVVAVRPQPELGRALETPTRELVQQEADRATYERRAVAVQRERAIAENELQNQIELATREQQLVAQRGLNERRRAEESAEANRIESEASAARNRLTAEVNVEASRQMGLAAAETETARVAAYRDVPAATLLVLALRELQGVLPQIGTLNLSPDLLTTALGRLVNGERVAVGGDER